jgi:hypothetical protein
MEMACVLVLAEVFGGEVGREFEGEMVAIVLAWVGGPSPLSVFADDFREKVGDTLAWRLPFSSVVKHFGEAGREMEVETMVWAAGISSLSVLVRSVGSSPLSVVAGEFGKAAVELAGAAFIVSTIRIMG